MTTVIREERRVRDSADATRAPVIWVPQEDPRKDISPALAYGDIRVILPPGDFNHSYDLLFQSISQAMREYEHEDCLLLIGDPVLIAMTACAASEAVRPMRTLRLLKWEPRERKYFRVQVLVRP